MQPSFSTSRQFSFEFKSSRLKRCSNSDLLSASDLIRRVHASWHTTAPPRADVTVPMVTPGVGGGGGGGQEMLAAESRL